MLKASKPMDAAVKAAARGRWRREFRLSLGDRVVNISPTCCALSTGSMLETSKPMDAAVKAAGRGDVGVRSHRLEVTF